MKDDKATMNAYNIIPLVFRDAPEDMVNLFTLPDKVYAALK